jgi:hypothetical protein
MIIVKGKIKLCPSYFDYLFSQPGLRQKVEEENIQLLLKLFRAFLFLIFPDQVCKEVGG